MALKPAYNVFGISAVSSRSRVSRPWLRPRTPVSSSRKPMWGSARSVRPKGDGSRLSSCHLNSAESPPKPVKLRLSNPGTLWIEKRLALAPNSTLNPSTGANLKVFLKPSTSLCCTGRGRGRTGPYPDPGSCDADGLRASQLQHAVERVDADVDLGHAAPVGARVQPVPDHALVPRDGRLGPGAGVVARRL